MTLLWHLRVLGELQSGCLGLWLSWQLIPWFLVHRSLSSPPSAHLYSYLSFLFQPCFWLILPPTLLLLLCHFHLSHPISPSIAPPPSSLPSVSQPPVPASSLFPSLFLSVSLRCKQKNVQPVHPRLHSMVEITFTYPPKFKWKHTLPSPMQCAHLLLRLMPFLQQKQDQVDIFHLASGHCRASLVAQPVKNPPATRETWVQSLGWEDTLEKGKATNSTILAWRTQTIQSMGLQRVGHDWAACTFAFWTLCHFSCCLWEGLLPEPECVRHSRCGQHAPVQTHRHTDTF